MSDLPAEHELPKRASPWPHRLAVALACATFPLVWVGGLVTTTDSGMAVPDWPNTYGYNLFLYPWSEWILGPWGLFIEHAHRLFGAAVGMLTIALAIAAWRLEQSRSIRRLAGAALLGVIGQGVLGGMRVLWDERTLAMIHGCAGPAFFALCVSLAVCTSPAWQPGWDDRPMAGTAAVRLLPLAVVTTAVAYGQLVLGALVRHMPVAAPPSTYRVAVVFHLVFAAALVVHAVGLWLSVRRGGWSSGLLGWAARSLALLVALQVVLGGATWVVQFGWPAWAADRSWTAAYTIGGGGFLQTHVVTGHAAVGSLIVAAALTTALGAWQASWSAAAPGAVAMVAVSQPAPELDGAGCLPAPELVPDANMKAER